MKAALAKITGWLDGRLNSDEFKRDTAELLVKLISADTTPNPDPSVMRENEAKCFKTIIDELACLDGEGKYHPIRTSIQKHPAYSQLHFTKTASRPQGLGFKETYEGRYNYVFKLLPRGGHNPKGRSLALNAHIDVVAPYLPPAVKDGIVSGRGACDDKGGVAVMIRAAQLLDRLVKEGLVRLNRQATFMFVIEEETGGNGSLSLALDKKLRKEYDSILVHECTDNRIHPANRGAVWYRTELDVDESDFVGAAAYVVLAMEDEGARIKSESRHPLFPQRPVQTCHGIIGAFGEHPSRINGYVPLLVRTRMHRAVMEDILKEAAAKYVERYGDKTHEVNPDTGRPKVERHFSMEEISPGEFKLEVFGSTGHMGSILENDCAITKMAYLVRDFIRNAKDADVRIFQEKPGAKPVQVLEGGQGFLPTHKIDEIMRRMAGAAEKGLADYFSNVRKGKASGRCSTTYDKLHNAAFDGNPSSPQMLNALRAMKLCGMPGADEPVTGWHVSCDARLFATEYPSMPVITMGPGKLKHAHSDTECISVEEIAAAVRFAVLYILIETGSLKLPP